MKKLILLVGALASPASAFDLPRGFYTAETLQDARMAAAEKPKMVGVLITRPDLQPS
jgi:hypothetical protein